MVVNHLPVVSPREEFVTCIHMILLFKSAGIYRLEHGRQKSLHEGDRSTWNHQSMRERTYIGREREGHGIYLNTLERKTYMYQNERRYMMTSQQ